MLIEDGLGTGNKVEVAHNNRLSTTAVVVTEMGNHSIADADAYSWTASADINATDSILWLRNDNTTKKLAIECIHVSSDAAGSWFVYCPANVTPDGTTVTGVNLNRSSSKVALATCKRDNTTTTLANYIYYGHSLAADTKTFSFHGALILGYLDCVAVDITTEPALAQCTIFGYYVDD